MKGSNKSVYYSLLSGTSAAMGSFCGKLFSLPVLQGPLIILRVAFLCLMIIFNSGGLTLYVKALQASKTSLTSTILSAASNYFLSALIGFIIFGELVTLMWWFGMTLVLLGVVFIAKDNSDRAINKGPLIILRVAFLCLMIIFNSGGLTLYVKALQASKTSLTSTILSAASNYFLSALIGLIIFGELVTRMWWFGMTLVLLGVVFIAKDNSDRAINKVD